METEDATAMGGVDPSNIHFAGEYDPRTDPKGNRDIISPEVKRYLERTGESIGESLEGLLVVGLDENNIVIAKELLALLHTRFRAQEEKFRGSTH